MNLATSPRVAACLCDLRTQLVPRPILRMGSSLPEPLRNKIFHPGDLIVSASPFAHVINMANNGINCDWCAFPGKLRRCTACLYEAYCSQSCQKKAWSYHKFECPLLKAKQPKVPANSVRLFCKVVFNYVNSIQRPENDPGWRIFHDLCHHDEQMKKDPLRLKEFLQVSHSLCLYIGLERSRSWLPDQVTLLQLFGRMVFNTFELYHMVKTIGAGVYISPSVFDHSCDPNAVFVNNGTIINIRAIKDINTCAEPILINYYEPRAPRYIRQSYLKQTYYFTCVCSKCQDDHFEELNLSTICPKCHGNIILRNDQLQCLDCSCIVTDVIYQKKREMLEEKVKTLCEQATVTDKVDEIKELISKNDMLTERNTYLQFLQGDLYAIEMNADNILVSYELGQLLYPKFKLHVSEYFPALGEHQFKQARMAAEMKRFDAAEAHYNEALRLLTVSHGPDHHMVKCCHRDVAELAVERSLI